MFKIENSTLLKPKLHLIIGSLICLTFILTIARLAVKGTPSSRANTWGIAVCLKAAVFLAYQVLTTRVDRFKRWASPKANMILDMIDTVFWFALIIITAMAVSESHSAASQGLGAIIIILALCLCSLVGFLSFICYRDWKHYRAYGSLPGASRSTGHHAEDC